MTQTATQRTARMTNPALLLPEAMTAFQEIGKALHASDFPQVPKGLAELRASQINGCSVCVDLHVRLMKGLGETDERLLALSAWRDSPLFTEAERAALDLAEAVTRLADRPDPVPDAVWAAAAQQFSERELAGLLVGLAVINAWNRLNVSTRQVAGEWRRSAEASAASAGRGTGARAWAAPSSDAVETAGAKAGH